jgi:hypothetical protein
MNMTKEECRIALQNGDDATIVIYNSFTWAITPSRDVTETIYKTSNGTFFMAVEFSGGLPYKSKDVIHVFKDYDEVNAFRQYAFQEKTVMKRKASLLKSTTSAITGMITRHP